MQFDCLIVVYTSGNSEHALIDKCSSHQWINLVSKKWISLLQLTAKGGIVSWQEFHSGPDLVMVSAVQEFHR